MWLFGGYMFDTLKDWWITVRGGRAVSKIKDINEGMVALSEMARNGARTEKVLAKLPKQSKTLSLSEKAFNALSDEMEDL